MIARDLRRDLRLLDLRPAPGCEVLDIRDLLAVEEAFTEGGRHPSEKA